MKELIEYTGGLLILLTMITAIACVWIGGQVLPKIWATEIVIIVLLWIVYNGITKGKGS